MFLTWIILPFLNNGSKTRCALNLFFLFFCSKRFILTHAWLLTAVFQSIRPSREQGFFGELLNKMEPNVYSCQAKEERWILGKRDKLLRRHFVYGIWNLLRSLPLLPHRGFFPQPPPHCPLTLNSGRSFRGVSPPLSVSPETLTLSTSEALAWWFCFFQCVSISF